jgi:hypothetical protein
MVNMGIRSVQPRWVVLRRRVFDPNLVPVLVVGLRTAAGLGVPRARSIGHPVPAGSRVGCPAGEVNRAPSRRQQRVWVSRATAWSIGHPVAANSGFGCPAGNCVVDWAPSRRPQRVWVSRGHLRGRLGTQSRATAGLGVQRAPAWSFGHPVAASSGFGCPVGRSFGHPVPAGSELWVSNGQLRGRLGTQSRAAAGLGA